MQNDDGSDTIGRRRTPKVKPQRTFERGVLCNDDPLRRESEHAMRALQENT